MAGMISRKAKAQVAQKMKKRTAATASIARIQSLIMIVPPFPGNRARGSGQGIDGAAAGRRSLLKVQQTSGQSQ